MNRVLRVLCVLDDLLESMLLGAIRWLNRPILKLRPGLVSGFVKATLVFNVLIVLVGGSVPVVPDCDMAFGRMPDQRIYDASTGLLGLPLKDIRFEHPLPIARHRATVEQVAQMSEALKPIEHLLDRVVQRTEDLAALAPDGIPAHAPITLDGVTVSALFRPLKALRADMLVSAAHANTTRTVEDARIALTLAELALAGSPKGDPWEPVLASLLGRFPIVTQLHDPELLRGADRAALTRLAQVLAQSTPAAVMVERALLAEPAWVANQMLPDLLAREGQTFHAGGALWPIAGPATGAERDQWVRAAHDALRRQANDVVARVHSSPDGACAAAIESAAARKALRWSFLGMLVEQVRCSASADARAEFFAEAMARAYSPKLNWVPETALEVDMCTRLAEVRIQLELYRRAHGMWPADLLALGLPPEALVDTAQGRPIGYAVHGAAYELSIEDAPFHTWACHEPNI